MKLKSLSFLIIIGLSGMARAQNDFEVVKQRVVSEIMKTPVNDSLVTELIKTIKDDGSWPGINYSDISRTGFEHSVHLNNIVAMSLAFNNKGSKHFKSKKLRQRINQSLTFWCQNDFICDNWWYNQIFTPLSLVTVLLIMDDKVDPALTEKAIQIAGRAHLGAPGARQGGDRIKIGGISAKNGLVVGDTSQFKQIMKVINDEIKFTTGDRGMQHDYSFHHRVDRVNTTYSYGRGYADAFAEWAAYVAGTRYAFSKEKLKQLIDYYLDGICKQFVYGIYIDKGVFNRGISRKETFGPHSTYTPEKLLKASDYRKSELEEIINLREGKIAPKASFSKFFWQSEHFVFQRPEFYTSVRMFSVRNRNMEQPYNSEGLLNHHRGDGTNFLSIKGDEYLNIWPVYDWQKIPGTTVLQKPGLPSAEEIQKDGVTDFVGAVTDGLYGAVGFDFISPHDFTKARKSWFFFDKEYVCLGAGIESTSSGLPVVTTLDQSLLKGDVVVGNGKNMTNLDVGKHELSDVKWVFHNGIGYQFPEPTHIHLSNKTAGGRWYDINKQWRSPKEIVKKEVFKLWIDHGIRPQGRMGGLRNESMIAKDVKYQYIVIPSADLKSMDSKRGIRILANNRLVQAVKHAELGIIQIIFYQAGTLAVSDKMSIEMESPGAVMIKMDGETIKEISVSDPSRKLSRLHMKISGEITEVPGDKFKSVFDNEKNRSELTIDLPSGFYAGQSVVLTF
ncbi:polysaccharide lyase family 8 super-sandwich domain-containing protein [Fulvivirgaceae bacterium BMA12]|uniref:Polysaccharide lyase family 8 super-sandwich domain-containing protein n=1 Tax=Agaribacillus aureus TaxID=3051825 RepID=A0ABT8LFS4_9BACT|nr:polysaccharide lyase family 8 super-sandwich domain-containing protein [Fulvivirgaceae bacterium BMA12]